MLALRRMLWVAGLLTALPAPAAAQDICAALDRIRTAAREPVPFASLASALERGEEVVPGFRATDCVANARGLACNVMTRPIRMFDGWPDPLPCRGLTLVSEGRARPRVPDWQRVYRMEGLRLSFGVRCSACAGPAFGGFGIGFERERDQSR